MTEIKDYRKLLGLAVVLGLMALSGCIPAAKMMPVGELQLTSDASGQDGVFSGLLFTPEDPYIEGTFDWPGYRKGAILSWAWKMPDGSAYSLEKRRAFAPRDNLRLPIAGTAAAGATGRWTLAVSQDEQVLAEKSFFIVADKDRWKAENAEHPNYRNDALEALCRKNDFAFLLGHFSFEVSQHERLLILDCLKEHFREAVPVLQGMLEKEPDNESLLAVAYQLKQHLLKELEVSGRLAPAEFRPLFLSLLQPWDIHLAAPLLKSDRSELRVLGCDLIGETRSPLAPLLLREVLEDPKAEVRQAAVEVLLKQPGDLARAVLTKHLSDEEVPAIRGRINQGLEKPVGQQ